MQADVETILQAWKAAFDAGDARAIASLYTDGAMFIGGLGGVHVGRAAIEGYFAQNAAPSRVDFRDIRRLKLADQVVVVSMIGAIAREGGAPRDFRFLQTLVRTADGWKIAGHHGSHSL